MLNFKIPFFDLKIVEAPNFDLLHLNRAEIYQRVVGRGGTSRQRSEQKAECRRIFKKIIVQIA